MLPRLYLTIPLALCFAWCAYAQRTDVRLLAVVTSWEKSNDSTLFSLTALDTVPDAAPLHGKCSSKGKCRLNLPLDHVYRVELSGEGHVPKHVVVDFNGPSIKQRKWGYRMRLKVPLMPRIDSVDYSICERPIGYASFDKKDNQFTWDERYTLELTPYYEAMQNRYEDVKKVKEEKGVKEVKEVKGVREEKEEKEEKERRR